MTPVFNGPESWRWDRAQEEAHLGAWLNSGLVLCRVSREAIEDHCGHPTSPKACLEAASNHCDEITSRLAALIVEGRFEADGSVLLRADDW
jgi:hypothetical protein